MVKMIQGSPASLREHFSLKEVLSCRKFRSIYHLITYFLEAYLTSLVMCPQKYYKFFKGSDNEVSFFCVYLPPNIYQFLRTVFYWENMEALISKSCYKILLQIRTIFYGLLTFIECQEFCQSISILKDRISQSSKQIYRL